MHDCVSRRIRKVRKDVLREYDGVSYNGFVKLVHLRGIGFKTNWFSRKNKPFPAAVNVRGLGVAV